MYKIIDTNTIEVDGVIHTISDEKMEEEGYSIVDRQEEIYNIAGWINAATPYDKQLMLQDLKQLLNIGDKYILSSLNRNEYISASEGGVSLNGDNIFENTCNDLISI